MYFLPNLADFYNSSSLLSQKKKKSLLSYQFMKKLSISLRFLDEITVVDSEGVWSFYVKLHAINRDKHT